MDGFAAAKDAKGRKAFAVPIELGSDDAEWTSLDRLSMAEWMSQQGFTSKRLLWLVDYACRDDYGATARDTSAWAGLWYFCARQSGIEKNEGFLSSAINSPRESSSHPPPPSPRCLWLG